MERRMTERARNASRAAVGRVRRAAEAEGARESGLAPLMYVHALSNAGDALIAVALARTVFFEVPLGEARLRVAAWLVVTMAPFVLLAPLVGPLLDRMHRGRRIALAATALLRGLVAWTLAGAVESDDVLTLLPAAFAVLVLSKSYGVLRASAMPRVLPADVPPVRANSRLHVAGIVAASAAVPIGLLVGQAGPGWPLRLAAVVLVGAGLAVFLLPEHVDTGTAELPLRPPRRPRSGRLRTRAAPLGRPVVIALRANAAIRAYNGLALLYLAFVVRAEPPPGLSGGLGLTLLMVGVGVGGLVGAVLGARVRRVAPERVIVGCLVLVAATSLLAALVWSAGTMILAMAVAALAQSLGKLSLDAVVQREVPEAVRASAFARCETALQLAWVVGGALGLALPLNGPDALAWLLTGGRLGLLVSAAGLAAALVFTARDVHRSSDDVAPDSDADGAWSWGDGPSPAEPGDPTAGPWAEPVPDGSADPDTRHLPGDASDRSADETVTLAGPAEGPTTRLPRSGGGSPPAPGSTAAGSAHGPAAPPSAPGSAGRESGQVGGGGHAPVTAWWARPTSDPPAERHRSEG